MHRLARFIALAFTSLLLVGGGLPCAAAIGDDLIGYWTGSTTSGAPVGLVIDARGFRGTAGAECSFHSTRIFYGDNRLIAADARMVCLSPATTSINAVDIDLQNGTLHVVLDGSFRSPFTPGFAADLVRSLGTARSDTIADARIPGHWHGTSGDFSAAIDLASNGQLTGTVSGPGMSGCAFAGLIPPAFAILNEQGFFVSTGPEVMVNCADTSLNVTYIAFVEATEAALTLRFVSALDGGRGGFIVRAMTRDDAREAKAGMWQSPSEDGWGLSVVTGETDARTPFVVLFVYSGTSPTWYVMPGAAWTGSTHFEGDLYVTTGSDWRSSTFTPGSVTKVGSLAMTFSSDDAGTLDYTITDSTGTHSIRKTIRKQQF